VRIRSGPATVTGDESSMKAIARRRICNNVTLVEKAAVSRMNRKSGDPPEMRTSR
jgi:hypothetical protein